MRVRFLLQTLAALLLASLILWKAPNEKWTTVVSVAISIAVGFYGIFFKRPHLPLIGTLGTAVIMLVSVEQMIGRSQWTSYGHLKLLWDLAEIILTAAFLFAVYNYHRQRKEDDKRTQV